MKFSVVTIFPQLITNYTSESILGRAQEDGHISVDTYDPRNFTDDKHDSVDAPPYGGGPGMVMQARPILQAVKSARQNSNAKKQNTKIFMTSARGDQFDAEMAADIEGDLEHAIIICGRYEGIDERVIEALDPTLISIGPYILTGGELPALVMIDAVSRPVPNVLGDEDSLEANRETAGAPLYTRPEEIEWEGEGYDVPDVLLSGHHKKIRHWRIANTRHEPQSTNQNTKKQGSS